MEKAVGTERLTGADDGRWEVAALTEEAGVLGAAAPVVLRGRWTAADLLLLPTAAAMALSFERAGAIAALCCCVLGVEETVAVEEKEEEEAWERALAAEAWTRDVAREYAKVVLVLRPDTADGVCAEDCPPGWGARGVRDSSPPHKEASKIGW